MPEIKNTFLKGRMNQDLDSRIIPNGEYREAINLLISRSEGSTVGEFENILGNTNVGTVSSTHKLNVIGNFIDETNNRVYAFATDFSNSDPNSRATSSTTCLILEFDLANPGTPNTLVSGFFLNFNKEFPIYGVNLLEELLFWTDNFNQPRRINITTARNNGSAYTKELQISVAKYYPYDAIIPMERQTVTTDTGGTTTQINITVGNANIRVGDVVTDNDKTDIPNATISNTSPVVKVVQILNPGTNTQFKVAPAITPGALASGIKVDFSRTSMENRSDPDKSNYSTQTVGTVMASGSGLSGTNLYPYATYPTTGATPGGSPYVGEPGVDAGFTTDSILGTGTGDITVVVNGLGGVSSIDAASDGTGWVIGDTITISSSVIGGSTDVVITLTAASIDTATIIRIDPAILGGVPRVGDVVTNITTANNIPNPTNPTVAAQFSLRISTIVINQVAIDNSGRWTITFDSDATAGGAIAGFTAADNITIAKNLLYESTFPGDTKFLDDKFVRFSYRFKFNDNEYSLMAPFSQIMFIPKQYGEFNLGQIDTQLLPSSNYSTDPGINNYYQDETDAYISTILEWFENDIDSIGLKIPLPDTALNTQSVYNIKAIEILYRESDALAVKVLDSIDVSAITTSQTYTIDYDDDLHGLLSQLYYNYTYKSNKPYKTLPEGQTTRVYDKVPIKALGQEIITNRIVYGNYVERMTPPSSIPYAVGFSDRDAQTTDYYTQYPFSTVKQNRIYQVGFVLVDYFGRQSDVILSSYDNQNLTSTVQAGSSMFVPYRGSGDSSIFNWIGTNLTLSIDEAIGATSNPTSGEPGVYKENGHVTQSGWTLGVVGSLAYYANKNYTTTASPAGGTGCTVRVTEISGATPGKIISLVILTSGTGYSNGDVLTIDGGAETITLTEVGAANPLGWYTYKVVVKQQEQEYYNVYIPGFINGLPVQDLLWDGVSIDAPIYPSATPLNTERGKIVFSTLLGDNINKIPRNLKEVGPTDEEYNSDEILYIRINNPNTTDTLQVRNLQYYPGTLAQNVLNIATVKETELAAVPFKPFNIAPIAVNTNLNPEGGATTGNQGEYGATTVYVPSGTTAELRIPAGRLPWGDVADKESFYAADQNPFIMKFSTVGNYGNPVGAIVAGSPLLGIPPAVNSVAHDSNYVNGVRAMEPCLSVAETKPVESLLDLFWETTLTGKIEELNASIESNYDGIVGITANSGTFAESIGNSGAIGPQFKFINGSGAEVVTVQSIPVITKVYRQNDVGQAQINPGFFTVAQILAGTTYQINTATYFWYSVDSNENPSSDVYIFDLQIVSGNTGQFTDTLTNTLTLTLTNVAPAIYSDAAYTTDVTGTTWTAPNAEVGETNILQLYGLNGSADTSGTPANRTRELIWGISGSPGTNISDFDISSDGLITTNTTLTNEQNYGIEVSLTDVNNTGSNKETVTATFNFTAGTANAPKIIGTGDSIASTAQKDMTGGTAEFAFINSNTYTGSAVGSPFSITPTFVYNAQTIYNITSAGAPHSCSGTGRADLFQGTIEIKPKLFNAAASVGDVTILFSIQYRATNGNNWSNIDTATGSTNTWASTQSQQQINHSTGVVNQETAYTYKFDQLGEYRVITNQMANDNYANVGQFTVEFKDGTYNTSAGPCVPA